jgi:hypothetical protein
MAAYISTCPSCRHTLDVTELSCPHCHIQIRGRFDSHPGLMLTDEQLSFLRLFVQSRGNLREIERVLGISYPTVRSKLDDLVDAFEKTPGAEPLPPAKPKTSDRRSILEDVAMGRLPLEDALDLLKRSPGPGEDARADY